MKKILHQLFPDKYSELEQSSATTSSSSSSSFKESSIESKINRSSSSPLKTSKKKYFFQNQSENGILSLGSSAKAKKDTPSFSAKSTPNVFIDQNSSEDEKTLRILTSPISGVGRWRQLHEKVAPIKKTSNEDNNNVENDEEEKRKSKNLSSCYSGLLSAVTLKDLNVTSNAEQRGREGEEPIDWEFWGMLFAVQLPPLREVSRRVEKGVPSQLRGAVWMALSENYYCSSCNAAETDIQFSKETFFASPTASSYSTQYFSLLGLPSPHEKIIQRDLARTFPNDPFFEKSDGAGQSSLFNVMKAFSIADPSIGYCQGLSFIAGVLLLQLPEEETFCLLLRMMSMEYYGMRSLFECKMEGLHICLYSLDRLIEERLSVLATHFKKEALQTNMFASQWFMTIFAYKLPFSLSFRLYDCFFLFGMQFLYQVALALLSLNSNKLLRYNFEGMLEFLKSEELFSELTPEIIISTARSFYISPEKDLERLKNEYLATIDDSKSIMVALADADSSGGGNGNGNGNETEIIINLEAKLVSSEKRRILYESLLVESKLENLRLEDENSIICKELQELRTSDCNTDQTLVKQIKEKDISLREMAGMLSKIEAELILIKMKFAESETSRQALAHEVEVLQRKLHQQFTGSNNSLLQPPLPPLPHRQEPSGSSFSSNSSSY